MVKFGFHGGGIGAKLVAGNEGRLLGLLHDPLVDQLSALLAKQSKGPTQIAKIWNRVFIKSGEASIEQTGSQFAVKLAIGPTFDVFEHHATQQPIRSDPFAAGFVGAWGAFGLSPRA